MDTTPALVDSEPSMPDRESIRRALRESELRLRSVLGNAPVVLWAIDREGIFTFSEGKLLEKLGLAPEAVVGQSIYRVYADAQEVLENNRRALQGEEFTAVTHVAGISFESRYTPQRDENGEITGVIGVAIDITDRVAAERQEQRIASLLLATLESTADGILVVDREGRIATYNQKFAEMWGLPPHVLDTGDDDVAIRHVLSQLVDPDAFVVKVKELYANPFSSSFDVLEFTDGRVVERYSQPQQVGEEIVGRVWSFRDVTERRHAELELQRRERQLEHSQHLAGLGSWQWDIAENKVTWSSELYRIYGLQPDEFPASFEGYLERVHPDDREHVQEQIGTVAREGGTFDFFERIVRPDGRVRTLHSQGEAILDTSRRVLRLVGACDDVTEQIEAEAVLRRSRDELEALVEERTSELAQANMALEEEIAERQRAEEELRNSTAELEGIFLALPDLYFRLTSKGEILAHRSGREASLALPPEAYIGARIQDLLPSEPKAAFEEGLRELVESGDSARIEYELPFEAGDRRFEARLLPHMDGQVVTIVRDITDRYRAETALRESEEHYRRLIENSSDVATILGPDGLNRYQSPSITYVLGYAPEEMVGTSAFERIHPDDGPQCREALQWVAAHPGQTRSVEFRYRHRDGSWRMLEARARTLLPDTAAEGMVINSRDITERKSYEIALEQAKIEAESANRAKSEFLSRMSHELRTPMNSILGFAQLLARKELPTDQRKSVDHILRAGRHLLNLINEVLEISRIEAGRQNFSLEPVPVAAVLQEAQSLIQPLATQSGITLDEYEPDPDLYVRADRQRLIQVLLNLLSNAVKYNRSNGHISLVCEEATDPEDGRATLRIGIRDTGPGIAPENIARLFVPFERLSADQSDVEGTGLGLALSLRLIEAMNGDVTVDSEAGKGSTFWVVLDRVVNPMERADAFTRRDTTVEIATVSSAAAKILYIEDNLPNMALVESILADRPEISVLPAIQGQMGVYLASENLPDLILLDIHLPDIPGHEVIRRLKDDPRTRSIPVVVVSADATPSTFERLLRAGASGYLTKPIDVAEFLSVVDRFISREGG